MSDRPPPLAAALAYHERTKHHPHRFAPSLGYLDWANEPDPFRRYAGAPLFRLDLRPPSDLPRYEPAFIEGSLPAAPLDRSSVSQLFHDALALSAWKQAGRSRWSLRVNPSSGNLHPTEGYLVAGAVDGLYPRPAVWHYAPHEHALERRLDLGDEAWATLARQLPPCALLVGLSSVYWRESWKYGERAFRYCQHDAGHAIAAVAIAAAGLGWSARLLEGATDAEVPALLGIAAQAGPEAERPLALVAVFPSGAPFPVERQRAFALPRDLTLRLRAAPWVGAPNALSPEHEDWAAIDAASEATEKGEPPGDAFWDKPALPNPSLAIGDSPLPLRRIIHQRRSAVDLDGRTGITRGALYQLLLKALPGDGQVPFATIPWRPRVDLALFIHRVADLAPGLYLLCRDPARREALRAAMDPTFAWARPQACPASLPLFLLRAGDARAAATRASCGQAIAGDGAVAFAMVAEYRDPLERLGAFFYRRLHWEAGALGQVLYLEAEASGVRGTGIGCFFDDVTHGLLGLSGDRFQDLYHFTLGGPVEDPRIQGHPPYAHLAPLPTPG